MLSMSISIEENQTTIFVACYASVFLHVEHQVVLKCRFKLKKLNLQ